MTLTAPPNQESATAATPSPGPFDARAFRNALGAFPTGVAIITTLDGGVPVGLTCNSFAAVSLDPPLVLWSLRRESQSLRAFSEAPAFAINVLAEDQNTLSAHFASGKIADKFEGVACSAGYGGVPLIEECIARFECSTFARHEAGDHVIFIGRVERFDVGSSGDALVFYKGAYMMLTESLRELTSKGRISDDALDEARTLVYGMLLRLGCERGTDADFDAIEGLLGQMECLVDSSDMPARAHQGCRVLRAAGPGGSRRGSRDRRALALDAALPRDRGEAPDDLPRRRRRRARRHPRPATRARRRRRRRCDGALREHRPPSRHGCRNVRATVAIFRSTDAKKILAKAAQRTGPTQPVQS